MLAVLAGASLARNGEEAWVFLEKLGVPGKKVAEIVWTWLTEWD